MTNATTGRTNTSRPPTNCGRAPGRTTRCSGTRRAASTPTRRKSTRSTTAGPGTPSTARTSRRPRRSAPRCCSRPAAPAAGSSSAPPTPRPPSPWRRTPDVAASTPRPSANRPWPPAATPDDVKFLQGMHFVVGGTEAEAPARPAELDEYLDIEALIAHVGGGFGVDLGGLPLDTPLGDLDTEGSQGAPDGHPRLRPRRQPHPPRPCAATAAGPTASWGRRNRSPTASRSGRTPGSTASTSSTRPSPAPTPTSSSGVLPELRRRGLAQPDYAPGTLREKLFGAGPRAQRPAPGRSFRGAFTANSAAAEQAQNALEDAR